MMNGKKYGLGWWRRVDVRYTRYGIVEWLQYWEGNTCTATMSQNISERIKGRLVWGRLCVWVHVLSFVTSIRFISLSRMSSCFRYFNHTLSFSFWTITTFVSIKWQNGETLHPLIRSWILTINNNEITIIFINMKERYQRKTNIPQLQTTNQFETRNTRYIWNKVIYPVSNDEHLFLITTSKKKIH
jgi:hypothetical protein